MKKVLILGCSHSAGNYNSNDPANADKNSGWPALIANTFLNYEVHCITHHGGGSINYMWSLGHLINKFGIQRRIYTAGKNKSTLDPFIEEKKEDFRI